MLGFVYTNNLAKHNSYGFIGTGHGVGGDSIAAFLPGAIISRNVLAGGNVGAYPAGNSFPLGRAVRSAVRVVRVGGLPADRRESLAERRHGRP